MLPNKLWFIWPNGFREEFLKSANQKQESSVVAMFDNGLGRNEQYLQRTFHRCFLPSFGSFGQAVSEENIFKNQPIRNKNCLWRPCLLMDRDKMSKLYRGPSIDASYKVSVHLQSSKLVGGPVPEASKIGLGLVKIPKLEVRLACAFFVGEVVSIFVSAVESFVKLLFQLFFK